MDQDNDGVSSLDFGKKWTEVFHVDDPLFDGEDYGEDRKTRESVVLEWQHNTHKIMVTRCIAGVVDIDAYDSWRKRRQETRPVSNVHGNAAGRMRTR